MADIIVIDIHVHESDVSRALAVDLSMEREASQPADWNPEPLGMALIQFIAHELGRPTSDRIDELVTQVEDAFRKAEIPFLGVRGALAVGGGPGHGLYLCSHPDLEPMKLRAVHEAHLRELLAKYVGSVDGWEWELIKPAKY